MASFREIAASALGKVTDCSCRCEYYSYKADFCVNSCWMKQLAGKSKTLEEDIVNSLRYYPYFIELPGKRYSEVFQALIKEENIKIIYDVLGDNTFSVLLDCFEPTCYKLFNQMKIQLAKVDPTYKIKSRTRDSCGIWFEAEFLQNETFEELSEDDIRFDRIKFCLKNEENLSILEKINSAGQEDPVTGSSASEDSVTGSSASEDSVTGSSASEDSVTGSSASDIHIRDLVRVSYLIILT